MDSPDNKPVSFWEQIGIYKNKTYNKIARSSPTETVVVILRLDY